MYYFFQTTGTLARYTHKVVQKDVLCSQKSFIETIHGFLSSREEVGGNLKQVIGDTFGGEMRQKPHVNCHLPYKYIFGVLKSVLFGSTSLEHGTG